MTRTFERTAVELGPKSLTQRQTTLVIQGSLGTPSWSGEQAADAIEPIHVLEWAELRRQEQLCVPLVPLNTYWYLTASPELMALVSDRMSAYQQGRRA